MNYKEANAMLSGRCAQSRKLANNTYLERRHGGDIAIRLHQTDIITMHPDGSTTLKTGGWRTMTTSARMNENLDGFFILKKGGIWYLARNWDDFSHPFREGMRIGPRGGIHGAGSKTVVKRLKEAKKAARKYAHDFIEALRAGKVGRPGPGDCFGCRLLDDNGRSIMRGHIKLHLEERYYVPSLLVNAVQEFHVSRMSRECARAWMDGVSVDDWFAEHAARELEKAIYRHTARELGLGV